MKLKIQTLSYVSLSDLPGGKELLDQDLHLTYGVGVYHPGFSGVSKEDLLIEIERHDNPSQTLLSAVRSIPDGVMIDLES